MSVMRISLPRPEPGRAASPPDHYSRKLIRKSPQVVPDGRSIQLLDRHRDALADADAHRRQRAFSAALFHAMHRGHREARAAHAQGMTERDGAAMRVDEIGIILDAELAQAG